MIIYTKFKHLVSVKHDIYRLGSVKLCLNEKAFAFSKYGFISDKNVYFIR